MNTNNKIKVLVEKDGMKFIKLEKKQLKRTFNSLDNRCHFRVCHGRIVLVLVPDHRCVSTTDSVTQIRLPSYLHQYAHSIVIPVHLVGGVCMHVIV